MMSNGFRLNDFISTYLQSHGFAFVLANYISLRDEYYSQCMG
jgi:hypothetical protein